MALNSYLNTTMNLRLATLEEAKDICTQDPVRPNIPYWWRAQPPNRRIYITEFCCFNATEEQYRSSIDAVLCVSLLNNIPTSEEELLQSDVSGPNAIFYTVWSNRKGAGRNIIFDVTRQLKTESETIVDRFITLSPKTEMAKRFHLRNGASLLQENETTNNFEY